MAGEQRRVAAESAAHAQGLADNLLKQGFVVESRGAYEWVLRKQRWRGDTVVTISIARPSMLQSNPPPPTPPPGNWVPPTG